MALYSMAMLALSLNGLLGLSTVCSHPFECIRSNVLTLSFAGKYQGLVMTGVWVIAHECKPYLDRMTVFV